MAPTCTRGSFCSLPPPLLGLASFLIGSASLFHFFLSLSPPLVVVRARCCVCECQGSEGVQQGACSRELAAASQGKQPELGAPFNKGASERETQAGKKKKKAAAVGGGTAEGGKKERERKKERARPPWARLSRAHSQSLHELELEGWGRGRAGDTPGPPGMASSVSTCNPLPLFLPSPSSSSPLRCPDTV